VTTFLPTITRRTEPVPRHDEPLAQAALCGTCPKLCRPACPVQNGTGREAVAPWRISDAVVRGSSAGWTVPLAEQVASCTGCLACAQPCLPGTNLPEESRAARAAAYAAGAALPAAHALHERLAAARPRAVPPPSAGTVLFLGCPARASAGVAASTARVTALPSFTEEPCCGAVALDLGLADDARALATSCAASLAEAARAVVASPSCARMIRDEWPLLGLPAPPVVTAVEWLAGEVAAGRVTFMPSDEPLAWHAPCTLTRALGVVDAPLAVLRALSPDVREPRATGLDTRCSGAGAAYPLVDPTGAEAVAAVRRAELAALDARVVTACPSAARALGATELFVLAAERLAR
jgi:Fe-S oxidoreductase